MLNALSFDVEEWYHPETLRRSGLPFQPTSQVVEATLPILALLHRHQTRATFFVVGEVAQAHPYLIEKILADNHELAFHGWTHLPLWELTPESFQAEIEQFFAWRDAHFAGIPILGYRAPTFSLDQSTAWAVPILQAFGFQYDSSIFPAQTPLYGVPNAPLKPYHLTRDELSLPVASGLLEIPMSVFPLGKWRIGFTGGLYLRFFPSWLIRAMINRQNRQQHAAVMYIHPWETYAPTPRLPLKWAEKFILYYGLPNLNKLDRLLTQFKFDTLQAVFLDKT